MTEQSILNPKLTTLQLGAKPAQCKSLILADCGNQLDEGTSDLVNYYLSCNNSVFLNTCAPRYRLSNELKSCGNNSNCTLRFEGSFKQFYAYWTNMLCV
ncbi:hypothetical protein F511_41586 [Dorcoceras hygrometricum]|uniref:Uncharacterized protein n=1 Tax=Dorcoceras hygrometricum TaxID=472368 RepID=A0A2Z7ATG0_9LAMI|nr:hypothetical protein F511_41586 [Dorcoceras hygrometricum]